MTLRVAVVADMLAEGWPSMDLMAEMLMAELQTPGAPGVEPTLIRPRFPLRVSSLVPGKNGGTPLTLDRVVHRYWDYPRWLRRRDAKWDVYHIVDHSYGHLAAVLPPGRVVVTCHDIDAFRPILDETSRESNLPRIFVRRLVRGLQAAAHVVCVSEATRTDLVRHDLVPVERLSVVPNGVHPSCTPIHDARADERLTALIGAPRGPELLHVGSTIPRKRIDTLLSLFAHVACRRPDVTLLRVGGTFTRAQDALVTSLGLAGRVRVLPFLDRSSLAALYRRSALVLLPSEREGFGLPLIEALACGTPVLASDIPVFREVGAGAADYVSGGDVEAWAARVSSLLDERDAADGRWEARRAAGLTHAARYSWARCTDAMRVVYERVARAGPR